jgi:hypothetical protein
VNSAKHNAQGYLRFTGFGAVMTVKCVIMMIRKVFIMVRTQIQLTKAQSEALRKLAAARGESIAELIRQSIDLFLRQAHESDVERSEKWRRARAVSGRFRSGLPDLSTNHDQYLAEDIADYPRRKVKAPV